MLSCIAARADKQTEHGRDPSWNGLYARASEPDSISYASPSVSPLACLWFARAVALVWKPDGDSLVADVGASSGPAAWLEGCAGVKFSKGQGVPGRAWASGSVEFAPNVQDLSADQYPRLELAKSCGIKGSAAIMKDGVVIEVGCSTPLSAAPSI